MFLLHLRRRLTAAADTTPALPPVSPARLAVLTPYVGGAVVCACALVYSLQLWKADLSAPLYAEGDVLLSQMFVANTLETGRYTNHPRAGAPYGLILYDFPLAEEFHMLFLRGFGLLTDNVFKVINWFYLMGFVLSTLSGIFVLRWFDVRPLPAVVGGVLFGFFPYHFWRYQAHLFLGSYYTIPPTLLVAVWLADGALLGGAPDPWRWRRRAVALLTAAAASSAGVYYAFFACFLFLVAGIGGVFRTGRVRAAVLGVGLIALTAGGMGLNIASSLLYVREHGKNPEVGTRHPVEAETYGHHVGMMFLPRHNHRVKDVREMKAKYLLVPGRLQQADLGGSVGTVGVVGLLAAVGAALFRRGVTDRPPVLALLGALAVALLALGTIGGLGSLFAYFVSPKIRGYDRISIFVGFVALAGVAILLDRLLARAGTGWWRHPARGLCLVVLGFGLWDQTSPLDRPRYQHNIPEHYRLNRFAARMEATLPPGGMVYQLPFVDFPERPPMDAMQCYDHFRLLLRSKTLRFSHGRAAGRPGAVNLKAAADLLPERMADLLVLMGFSGLHIDRWGYGDRGVWIITRFQMTLGEPPVDCGNDRDVFFSLVKHREKLLAGLSAEEIGRAERDARRPLRVAWQRPFDGEERDGGRWWRWSTGPAGEVVFENPSPDSVALRLDFVSQVLTPEPAELIVSGLADHRSAYVGQFTTVALRFTLPPGRHTLRLECTAVRRVFPTRTLHFSVLDYRLRVEDEHPLLAKIRGE